GSYPSFRLRQNPDNLYKMEQSFNNGAAWSLAFDYSLLKPKSSNGSIDEFNQMVDASVNLTNIINQYDGDVTNINNEFVYDTTDGDGKRDAGLCMALTILVDTLSEYAYAIASGEIEEEAELNDHFGSLMDSIGGLFAIGGGAIAAAGLASPLGVGAIVLAYA